MGRNGQAPRVASQWDMGGGSLKIGQNFTKFYNLNLFCIFFLIRLQKNPYRAQTIPRFPPFSRRSFRGAPGRCSSYAVTLSRSPVVASRLLAY